MSTAFLASAASGQQPAAALAATPELSRAAFERFRGLSKTWSGKSTRGWAQTLRYQTIAGGSAVLETSFERTRESKWRRCSTWTASG